MPRNRRHLAFIDFAKTLLNLGSPVRGDVAFVDVVETFDKPSRQRGSIMLGKLQRIVENAIRVNGHNSPTID